MNQPSAMCWKDDILMLGDNDGVLLTWELKNGNIKYIYTHTHYTVYSIQYNIVYYYYCGIIDTVTDTGVLFVRLSLHLERATKNI